MTGSTVPGHPDHCKWVYAKINRRGANAVGVFIESMGEIVVDLAGCHTLLMLTRTPSRLAIQVGV